jgi:hypothetical protein
MAKQFPKNRFLVLYERRDTDLRGVKRPNREPCCVHAFAEPFNPSEIAWLVT